MPWALSRAKELREERSAAIYGWHRVCQTECRRRRRCRRPFGDIKSDSVQENSRVIITRIASRHAIEPRATRSVVTTEPTRVLWHDRQSTSIKNSLGGQCYSEDSNATSEDVYCYSEDFYSYSEDF